MYSIKSKKCFKISGEISVPGDKSISHRALILGSCVSGITSIENLLEGYDTVCTIKALRLLGVKITKNKNVWKVHGNGLGAFINPEKKLHLGNSGTGVRLLIGLVSGSNIEATFTGDHSLLKRPMKRIITPLEKTGSEIKCDQYKLPITVKGCRIPLPIKYKSELSSAQVKSAILLNGLTSTGDTIYTEKNKSRDHTENMLAFLGADIISKQLSDGSNQVTLKGLPNLNSRNIIVPNDPSSAAFPAAVALLIPKSSILIKNVCVNNLRIGFYHSLLQMGAKINFINKNTICGEKVADISVKYSKLKGITLQKERVPSMIDEFPIFSVIACFAKGTTIMKGIEELRNKESDRVKEIVDNLKKFGVDIKSTKNSIIIKGNNGLILENKVIIDSKLDHRIAMTFLCLGLLCKNGVQVQNAETINTSFPNFCKIMSSVGAKFEINYEK